MTRKLIIRWCIQIFLAYILIGSVYFFSGFLYNFCIGKQNVFSPVIDIPLTLSGWPWMVYADLIHINELGLRIPTVLALSTILIILIIFITKHYKNSTY